ncbi:MAG: hypothetical protein AAB400_00665 [Patescibacteria group bacterium]
MKDTSSTSDRQRLVKELLQAYLNNGDVPNAELCAQHWLQRELNTEEYSHLALALAHHKSSSASDPKSFSDACELAVKQDLPTETCDIIARYIMKNVPAGYMTLTGVLTLSLSITLREELVQMIAKASDDIDMHYFSALAVAQREELVCFILDHPKMSLARAVEIACPGMTSRTLRRLFNQCLMHNLSFALVVADMLQQKVLWELLLSQCIQLGLFKLVFEVIERLDTPTLREDQFEMCFDSALEEGLNQECILAAQRLPAYRGKIQRHLLAERQYSAAYSVASIDKQPKIFDAIILDYTKNATVTLPDVDFLLECVEHAGKAGRNALVEFAFEKHPTLALLEGLAQRGVKLPQDKLDQRLALQRDELDGDAICALVRLGAEKGIDSIFARVAVHAHGIKDITTSFAILERFSGLASSHDSGIEEARKKLWTRCLETNDVDIIMTCARLTGEVASLPELAKLKERVELKGEKIQLAPIVH